MQSVNAITATILLANTANKNIIRNINSAIQISTTVEIFMCSKLTRGDGVLYSELHEVKQKQAKTSKNEQHIHSTP